MLTLVLIQLNSHGTQIVEAAVEARWRDKAHWPTILILMAVLPCLLCWAAFGFSWAAAFTGLLSGAQGRIFFDYLHNWFNFQALNYTGDGKDDAWSDLQLRKLRKWLTFDNEIYIRALVWSTMGVAQWFVYLAYVR